MKSKKIMIAVSGIMRECLQPYADIFEQIVIPMVQHVPLEMIDKSLGKNLQGEISGFEHSRNHFQHVFLSYCGLMLYCYYSEKESIKIKDRRRKLNGLNLLTKARLLIHLAYQQYEVFEMGPYII